MKRNETAYYCSSCSPSSRASDPRSYSWIDIQHGWGGDFKCIDKLFEGESNIDIWGNENRIRMAKIILEHFTGKPQSIELAKKLNDWPGHSLCRLTESDLNCFLQENGQLDLFGGANV